MLYMLDMDIIWMRYAIIFASFAYFSKDVTIGAVLIYHSNLIGYGWNSAKLLNDPSAHAEIIALRIGGKILGNYRLLDTVLYVTLEPCIMCIGAMIHARINRLVCGAKNNKINLIDLWIKYVLNHPIINHKVVVTTGVLEKICINQINNFFRNKRK